MKANKKRFYIIGIAGVATGNLAALLKQKGYDVAGSDQEMYEPMRSFLANQKIKVFAPYSAFHVKQWKPDIVVVGNAISRGNPELEWTLSNGHIYRSVSDILTEEFIENSAFHGKHQKKSIVIAGTHGKTTTTALIAWILERAGLDPTVFVGGFAGNFSGGAKLGNGKYVVLEGDEYDTAFFDKNPKFLHYRPFFGLLNNIELDHVDIYQDIGAIKVAFKNFIKLIPKNGILAVNREDKNTWNLVREAKKSKALWKNNSEPKIVSFGLNNGDFYAKNVSYLPDSKAGETNYMYFDVFHLPRLASGKAGGKQKIMSIKTNLMGKHNISNILGAIALARKIGVSCETIKKAIFSFSGVKRRMEVIGEKNSILVIDDYAHHPTAVSATISAARERRFRGRIIAIFEPGSASSRRNVFEKEYARSLNKADIALIYKPFKQGQISPVRELVHGIRPSVRKIYSNNTASHRLFSNGISKQESFSGKRVSREINRYGGRSEFFEYLDKLMLHVKQIARPGDIILIMSCRGFDGLREKIMQIL